MAIATNTSLTYSSVAIREQLSDVIYSIVSMVNVDLGNRWLEFLCTTGTGVLD